MSEVRTAQDRQTFWIYGGLALLFVALSLTLARNVDFRVYWYGVHGFFDGTRPAYGLNSGIGYPLEYRYAPPTYLLLYPLRAVSLKAGGVLWMLAACFTVLLSVVLAIRIRGYRFSRFAAVAVTAHMLAYLVLAVRYGNVQPFVIAWLFMALILAESKPAWAGALLALAVTFKVWPVLFVPWLLHRSRWRAGAWFVASFVALWVAPVLFFGVAGYRKLILDWYEAVGRVGTTYSEFYYFPGQSLRGILLRLFTTVPAPLKNFPDVHVLSLQPHTAVMMWGVLSLVAYSFFAIQMLQSTREKLWVWDGLIFVLYSLLEPYAVKSGLISVGPAALTAACLYTLGSSASSAPGDTRGNRLASTLFLAACAITFLQAIVQYGPWQRFLLSVGMDFWAGVLLLGALYGWIRLTGQLRPAESGRSNRLFLDFR